MAVVLTKFGSDSKIINNPKAGNKILILLNHYKSVTANSFIGHASYVLGFDSNSFNSIIGNQVRCQTLSCNEREEK